MALNFAANLSMLYTDVPFLDRFLRAAQAGFTTVEFLFPYDAGVEAVKSRLDDLGLKVALFNFHAGDIKNDEWGTLSNPDRREYFEWNCISAIEASKALRCSRLNAMFGQRVTGYDLAAQIDCACENLIWTAPQAADAEVELHLDALNPIDFPRYALNRVTMALEIIRRINLPNVRLQYDVYHAQMTEGNLINTITTNFSDIGHIQIADVPGRHQPGTGEINFPAIFAALDRLGYTGYIGLEYKPLGESDSSLSWLPLAERKVAR